MTDIIMYDDPDIVEFKTDIKGWITTKGRYYFGDNKDSEHMARYNACTHDLCKCGKIKEKFYMYCSECREVRKKERYDKMPYKDYDYETPLYSDYIDKFFSSYSECCEYCYDNKLNPADMRLIICEYQYCNPIDPYDYYIDIIPEEVEELPDYVLDAFDTLNDILNTQKESVSYVPGKFKTFIDCR